MNIGIVIWLVVVACAAAAACTAQNEARDSRTVHTTQGPVRGYKSNDGTLFQFFGIPYATAPNGTHRFTAPLPGPVWMQPLEDKDKGIICPQPQSPLTMAKTQQENCLVANIHVPKTQETKLPVLVYVHGGGYVMGFGEIGSPVSLARSGKLIAVTFNYRLGAHGFLCLGTKAAPGNAGMKDQVALLRWVQKNIANFGGNPDDVTIAGGSAGSSAVDLLMLSDIAKGLFNKVIPESGASVSAWSVQMDPVEYAKDFARINNFSNIDDILALEEYYKSATFEELTSQGMLLKPDSSLHFTPCIERDLGQEMFLYDAPINILKQGKYKKVLVLNGFANMEGLFAIPYFDDRKDKMNAHFADFLPADLQFNSEKEKIEIANTVKTFYFDDKPVGEETIQGYIDYFSDVMFAYSHLRSVKLQVEAGSDSVYLYEYSLFSHFPDGLYPDFMKEIRGAGHCAQSVALYETVLSHLYINEESKEYINMKATLREMWINFITIGKPVPEGSDLPAWPPVGVNRSPHMSLGEEIKLKGPLLEKRAHFWDKLYERYSRAPVPPTIFGVKTEL